MLVLLNCPSNSQSLMDAAATDEIAELYDRNWRFVAVNVGAVAFGTAYRAWSMCEENTAYAWSREANPTLGEYGPPTMLFKHGPVPDME